MNEITTATFSAAGSAILLYLGSLLAIAGGLQAVIAKLTIPILEPIRDRLKLNEQQYQVEVDIALFLTALFAMIFTPAFGVLKGFLAPVIALSPVAVPDVAIGGLSVLLLVAGQDFIKGLITRQTAVNEAIAEIEIIDPTPQLPTKNEKTWEKSV